MSETKDESKSKNPKKVNLSDQSSIKHLLDESVSEIVKSRRYVENTRLSNLKLLIGTVVIIIALFAQFYNKKFPENRDFLLGCITLYVIVKGILQLVSYTKEKKNAILFTHPPAGAFSTGLMVSSKLPRFSDLYTLTVASADPESISATLPVLLNSKQVDEESRHGRLDRDWTLGMLSGLAFFLAATVVDAYRLIQFCRSLSSCKLISSSSKSALRRGVMSFLRGLGHNAAICKTKWTSSGNITSGSYEFIDVVPVQSGSSMWQSRYFVDLDFAAQFEIARPSSQYSRLLQLLPRNFAGSSEDLKRIVRVTCDAAKRSLKSTDLSVPPWRKNRYMQNKWLGPYKRTVNPLTERTFSTDSAIFAPVSGAKCRCVGFDDAVSDSTVNGRLYVRT